MDWQPIETAPEGVRILVWVTKARWDVGEDCSSPRSSDQPFAISAVMRPNGLWIDENFQVGANVTATHWKHLSEPSARTIPITAYVTGDDQEVKAL